MMYIAVLACLSVCLAGRLDDQAWQDYKLQFGKVYTEEEDAIRYETWRKTVEEIEMHNSEYSKTYTQGVNQFTDMSDEEFEQGYGGCLTIPEEYMNGTATDAEEFAPSTVALPDSVNWVSQGYVTPVKNQGHCGSCYSFSATGALEGAWYKKTKKLPSLSEQQIVDCSGRYGNHGCRGGWYMSAWRYVRDAGGNEGEDTYRYTARQGRCHFNRANVKAKCTGYVMTRAGSESALTQALATVGPVSIAINAGLRSFRSYRHGVYYDRMCSSYRLNHAVLAVGYGRENGQDYFLVKNSWGKGYGQGGYIKMSRNRNNNCGIASRPSYPKV